MMFMQQGPLMVRRRSVGAGFTSPIQSGMIQLLDTLSDTDHQLSGVSWTPGGAMFVSSMADTVTNPYTGASSQGCIGFEIDGYDTSHLRWDNGHATVSRTIPALPIQPIHYASSRRASVDAWLAGGATIGQVTGNSGLTTYHMMTLFNSGVLNLQSGALTLASGASQKITTSFVPKAVIILEAGNNPGNNVECAYSFTSWDGATMRTASLYHLVLNTTSPRQTSGSLSDTNIGYNRVSLVESDGVTFTSRGFTSNSPLRYLIIGGCNAWAGFVPGPTATGSHDFKAASGAPAWTPYFAMSLPNFISTALGVDDPNGGAYAWGVSQISEHSADCMAWRSTDAAGSGGSVEDACTAIPGTAIDVYDHRKQGRLVSPFTQFIAGGWRGNATTVPSFALNIPTLLIG